MDGRYIYASGYRTPDEAREAMYSLFAEGQISYADGPQIEHVGGRRPYGITLALPGY
jgi:hypothetical protein